MLEIARLGVTLTPVVPITSSILRRLEKCIVFKGRDSLWSVRFEVI